ncbi:MAG TPA: ABC transporter permease [Candidatus Ornithocaccomicrobium faecavium]|uniref:ABC transporter permease n=1 Tax=Candidatus Ornithocaccomicrobium faecavium TaxID=2840890 RepID=A0A9D1P9K6_9FIRM|nr:ABC transporter permease [Candidatus Ornithocaccomicrobium faecavium]
MKKSNIGAIIRKEFNRFFTDRRLVMTAIILPGLMIYLLYSFMGSAMSDMYSVEDDFAPTVYAVNAPASIAALAQEAGMTLTDVSPQEAEGVRAQIVDKQAELLAVFPADFDAQVAAYAPGAGEAPNIELYYNSTDADSSQAHAMFAALLDGYESSLVNKFDVNRGVDADLASERDTAGQIFSSMLPLLMMVFLFSGCMAVAPESIAGEKERGSIATLLVTPLGRGELAMGKVISLGCISLLSGASSFLGTMLSLPKLMGAGDVALEAAAYGAGDYAALFAVIASTVLLLTGMIAVLSAFAKTVKEASMLVMPLMIVSMLVGVTSMFGDVHAQLGWYCIPLYNSVQCMSGVLAFSASAAAVGVTVAVNLALAACMTLILRRLFNSESVMFSR